MAQLPEKMTKEIKGAISQRQEVLQKKMVIKSNSKSGRIQVFDP